MKKYLAAILAIGILSGLFFLRESATSALAASCPAQVLDLANWKHTLPTGPVGSPTEIKQTTLATYLNDTFFRVNSTSDAVVFRAPVNGVTTGGSSYPRSELREMKDNGQNMAGWSTASGAHTMFIDEAITAVPKAKKHVVAGQIHNADDDVIVIRLEYPKLFIDINGNDGPVLDSNYTLGKRFTVKFAAEGGKIKIFYNGAADPVYTLDKKTSGCYFKAGAYTQSNCSKESDCSASNFGEVTIYDLKVRHGNTLADISTPETSPKVPVVTAISNSPVNGLFFEAESGITTAPMKKISNSRASGKKYVTQKSKKGTGYVKYNVNIPTTGVYRLKARVIATNGASNSVFWAIDDTDSNIWHFPSKLKKWTWVNGPTVTLSEGLHTFIVEKRERNTLLDKFEFENIGGDAT